MRRTLYLNFKIRFPDREELAEIIDRCGRVFRTTKSNEEARWEAKKERERDRGARERKLELSKARRKSENYSDSKERVIRTAELKVSRFFTYICLPETELM